MRMIQASRLNRHIYKIQLVRSENNEDKFSNENHADVAPLDVVADAEEETSRGKDDAISVT